MAIHTVAYNTSSATATPNPTGLTVIADGILGASGTDKFIIPPGMSILAAFVGGQGGSLPVVTSGRINLPSALRVQYPQIVPVGTVPPPTNPNIYAAGANPVLVHDSEMLGIDATWTAGTTGDMFGLIWLADQPQPVPAGESYWLRVTSRPSVNTTAKAWSPVPLTGLTLPQGRYAVIGFEAHLGAPGSPVAARLVFPGDWHRPGTLAMSLPTDRTADCFLNGSLGVWGTFDAFNPPSVEVLAIGSITTATDLDFLLRVVKL